MSRRRIARCGARRLCAIFFSPRSSARSDEEHSDEGQRHPAVQGRHALHRDPRPRAVRGGPDDGRQRHRLAGRDGAGPARRHADVSRSHLGGGAQSRQRRRRQRRLGDGPRAADLRPRHRTRRGAADDADAPRALPAGARRGHADGRDLVLRRRQGGGRVAGLREPDAQGLHPRLAGRGGGGERLRGREYGDGRSALRGALHRAMSGSTFGEFFRVTNFGESHGPAVGCVIDGCPPGLELGVADIQFELDRRRPGTSRHVTQRNEPDAVEILSGVFEGVTTGTPIALLIRNTDQRSKDYGNLLDTFRPGHADYTYWRKYGLRDPRGGGRASARLTAPMVAAGAVAKKWLRLHHGTTFVGWMSALGEIEIPFDDEAEIGRNPFFAPSAAIVPALEAHMDALRRAGDSCGARIEVRARGVPVGLGEPLADKLDADRKSTRLNSSHQKISY